MRQHTCKLRTPPLLLEVAWLHTQQQSGGMIDAVVLLELIATIAIGHAQLQQVMKFVHALYAFGLFRFRCTANREFADG